MSHLTSTLKTGPIVSNPLSLKCLSGQTVVKILLDKTIRAAIKATKDTPEQAQSILLLKFTNGHSTKCVRQQCDDLAFHIFARIRKLKIPTVLQLMLVSVLSVELSKLSSDAYVVWPRRVVFPMCTCIVSYRGCGMYMCKRSK
jgi:hypothetical protein